MGRFCFNIDDALEAKFRQEISQRLGMKKGNIQIAVEEAINDWIDNRESGVMRPAHTGLESR